MKSSRDYLGLSNSCSYNVDDVIGRADRFGFQNFCSPALNVCMKKFDDKKLIIDNLTAL